MGEYGFQLGSEALNMGFEKWKTVCVLTEYWLYGAWVITDCTYIAQLATPKRWNSNAPLSHQAYPLVANIPRPWNV